MAQFMNQEPNPQEKDSAKGATLKPAPASVDWNDANDGGVSALERAYLMAQAKTPATSAGDSFAAGVGNSIVAAAIRKASAPAFIPEQGFDAKKYLGTDSRTKLYTPSAEEIEYLHGATSREEYDYRVQDMLTQRNRDRMMSDNVAAGIAGMLLGDSPFILAPMAAGGIAGRTGLAVRSAIRAGDVATAVYAQDQLGQSAGVTALIAGVSGIDQLWDMSRTAKVAARAAGAADTAPAAEAASSTATEYAVTDYSKPMFDPDAPTTRTARDTDVTGVGEITLASVMDEALAEPITVVANNVAGVILKAQHVTQYLRSTGTLTRGQEVLLDAIEPVVRDVDFTLMAGTDRVVARSRHTFNPDNLTAPGTVMLRAPAAAEGSTWSTVGDALRATDVETRGVALHELIHAATSRALYADPSLAERLKPIQEHLQQTANLKGELKYIASDPHEMLAGLANNPDWVQLLSRTPSQTAGKSVLRQLGEAVLQAFGITARGSSLDDVLNTFEAAVKWSADNTSAAQYEFRSDIMREAAVGALREQNEFLKAKAMMEGTKKAFARNFALYDNIAQGSEYLARLLVSDATSVGARRPSVVDYKRNLTLEMDASAAIVEDAILSALKARNIGPLSRFFHRSNFRAARADLESRLGHYLDSAYDAQLNGRAVPVPEADIAPLVEAYKRSGWAGRWHDHMSAAGLLDDADVLKSDYYFPRQYSYDKLRQGLLEGRTLDNYRDLFRQALRDIYHNIKPEVVQQVAKEMVDGIYNGRAYGRGPMWRQLINGMSEDELLEAMRNAGVSDSAINSFAAANLRSSGATNPARNLRHRNRFNMRKEYMVDGQVMRMQDLMDTNVPKVMHGYTNRMSGRVGMAYAGVYDLKTLETMINSGKHSVANPEKWERVVDDTIDFILGWMPADANLPDMLRAAGNIANATMLKNPGLYQITDTALSLKTFGMTRVARSMAEQPWFKEGAVVFGSKDMSERLDSILRGGIQRDMRFRWFNTYADDNLDLTRQAPWFNVIQNVGQAARHVNGMSMVHRLQVNLNSGIVADELKQMFKGDSEAFKRLEKFGLDRDVADRAIAAEKANPGAVFDPELQMQIEVVGVRMMDYLVQQIRTGETSHFAQFNPVGKLIVGFQSFAVATTNKILRRELNDAGWIGLAHIMAYQFPLMLLATKAKHSMDGKDVDTRRLVTEAVMGMSAIGGISLLQDIFTGDSPRHSLVSMGYITGLLDAVQALATGDMDIQTFTKQVPLIHEFAPTRAIINNLGDD